MTAFMAVTVVLGSPNQNPEPSFHGQPLSWWVDQYGGFKGTKPASDADSAMSAIGTNAIPFLLEWIRGVDNQPTPESGQRAWSAAASFAALGTNADSAIPELKAILANPTNGTACVVAERALTRIGPDGFQAVLDVIATPGLEHRGALMQGDAIAPHIRAPDVTTAPGQADPNYKINSERAAPVLLKCAQDEDRMIRRWSFMLLSHADAQATVPALTNFLAGSPPPEIRRQATDALAKHGKAAAVAVPFLLSRLNDSNPDVRTEATNALMKIAPEAVGNRK